MRYLANMWRQATSSLESDSHRPRWRGSMPDNAIAVPGHEAERAPLLIAWRCARRGRAYLPVLAILAAACHDPDKGNGGVPLPPRPVAISISGPGEVTHPAPAQFTALQIWSDGSSIDVTAGAQWTSTESVGALDQRWARDGAGNRKCRTDGRIRAAYQCTQIGTRHTGDARVGWCVHADHRRRRLQRVDAAGAEAADVHRDRPAEQGVSECRSLERGGVQRPDFQS